MSLIPNLSQSAPGVPLYVPASGGGGGGGAVSQFSTASISSLSVSSINGATPGGLNPNPSFSTVNFPANAAINMSQLLQFGDAATGSLNDIYLRTGTDANTIVAGYAPGGAANTIEIYNPAGGTGASIIKMGSSDNGSVVLASARNLDAAPSSLFIVADRITVPYDLSVSSINGAAPSGGLLANIVCSTLGVVSAAIINGGITTQNLYTNGAGNAVTVNTAPAQVSGTIALETPNATGAAIGMTATNANGISIVTDTAGSYMGASGNFALSNVSSVNGSVYPPPAIQTVSTTNLQYTQQFNSLSYAGGLLQSVSTIFSSATISTNNFFQICGGLIGQINLQGSGNTNPLNNSTNTGYSHFSVDLLVDEGTGQEARLHLMDTQVTSSGNASPAQTAAWRPVSWSTINYPASYIVQNTPGINNLYPYGQEVMFLCFGKHTYKFLYGIDCFLNSGDPGAGYNLFVQFPYVSQIGNAVYQ